MLDIVPAWNLIIWCLEGESEVAVFSAKRWDRRSSQALIESATPCHDAQVEGPYCVSNPLRLTVLASKSEDYTTAPRHLQSCAVVLVSIVLIVTLLCCRITKLN